MYVMEIQMYDALITDKGIFMMNSMNIGQSGWPQLWYTHTNPPLTECQTAESNGLSLLAIQ